MTGQTIFVRHVRHSGESRNPETAIEIPWIPAFAGMTS
jgi:hypothetical protein